MENVHTNAVAPRASLPAVKKPELFQQFQTADGLWVVEQVVTDLMEPDFFMVQLVRHEEFGQAWAETKEIYSLDWPKWLVDSQAGLDMDSV